MDFDKELDRLISIYKTGGSLEDPNSNVFLSYAKEDDHLATRLYNDLTNNGLNIWFDKISLLGGQDWQLEIIKAIKSCKYFIALLSSNSINKRGLVQKELKEAIKVLEELPERTIYLIPVRLDKCEPTSDTLKKIHWIDLFKDWDQGIKEILRSTKSFIKQNDFNLYDIVNISTLLDKSIAATNHFAKKRKIKINFNNNSKDAKVRVNVPKLEQVFNNLFENAVKFSYLINEEHYSWVNISSYVRDKVIFICIENWGKPIDEEDITSGRIFDPFYVGKESKSSADSGLGLGLSIARMTIKEHKGSITVSSLPTRGTGLIRDYSQPFITTFTITLPVYEDSK